MHSSSWQKPQERRGFPHPTAEQFQVEPLDTDSWLPVKLNLRLMQEPQNKQMQQLKM